MKQYVVYSVDDMGFSELEYREYNNLKELLEDLFGYTEVGTEDEQTIAREFEDYWLENNYDSVPICIMDLQTKTEIVNIQGEV